MANNKEFKLDVVSIRLVKDKPLYSSIKCDQPEIAVAILWDYLGDFDREVMCVINLNQHLAPINVNFASVGSVSQTIAHPREVFKSSILSNASYIMLLHNHPSGDLKPSAMDIKKSEDLGKLCEMMGIPLIDHVIVGAGRDEYFSFAANNLLLKEKDGIADTKSAVPSKAVETEVISDVA